MLSAGLAARSSERCELCGSTEDLVVIPVGPGEGDDRAVAGCAVCADAIAAEGPLDGPRWMGLQGTAWSEVPPVQVLSWRLLHRVEAPWAQDLRDQVWLDEPTLAWAQAGLPQAPSGPATLDAHGTALADGDTVTLVKDLDVKGGGFTAKRGTTVKNIRLTEDPGLIEGRVNGVGIVLKTEFLKRLG